MTRWASFVVGSQDHRVVVGGADRGCVGLEELRRHVTSVIGAAAASRPDGGDTLAVLCAKMDCAQMVNETAEVVGLALHELVERGIVASDTLPPEPALPVVPQGTGRYPCIQASYRRAEVRLDWLEQAAAVLREHAAAVLPPRRLGPCAITRSAGPGDAWSF
jgi:hypothetical protein